MNRLARSVAISATMLLTLVAMVSAADRRTGRPIASTQVPSFPTLTVERATEARPTTGEAEKPSDVRGTLARYVLLRGDASPKLRLQLIDQWARDHRPGEDLTLIGEALVDPDVAVRERAQTLFDREWTRP